MIASNVYKIFLKSFIFCAILMLTYSCGSNKYTSNKNEYNPTPPVKQPWPEVKEEVKQPEVKQEKVQFNFALIMPFELKENLSIDDASNGDPQIKSSSLPALNFYEGAMMALDSCNNENRQIGVTAYETPSDSLGLLRIFNNSTFKSPDLIIASLPNRMIGTAAALAAKRNLNILFTQASDDEVIGSYKNTALAYTSTKTQCRQMVAYITGNYINSNIILVYRKVKREDELADVFKKDLLSKIDASNFHEFNATQKEIDGLSPLLSKTKRNVILIVSSDEAFVSPVISLLNEQEISGIKISGLPTWQNFESIDFMAFQNLEFFIFENNFIDYEAGMVADFRKKFISRYHSDPLPAAYNGFELIYNIGTTITQKSHDLHKILINAFHSENSNYNFEQSGSGGLENNKISVLTFKDYSLHKVPFKQ